MDSCGLNTAGHAHIGKYCLWWHYGFCSNLDVVEEHNRMAGEERTFVLRPADCTCEYWDLGYLLNETPSPGPRSSLQSISASPGLAGKQKSPVDEVGGSLDVNPPPASLGQHHIEKSVKDIDDMDRGKG